MITLSQPFLTEADSRAAVRGSRDPLGIIPIWSHFGRYVVGNLTTVTNSVRGFTTVLLGVYLANEILAKSESRNTSSTLELFLKFEQLAAYSRYQINGDEDFRGLRRVQYWLSQRPVAALSGERPFQILSDQKVYGLWGLYTMAARASGLLQHDDVTLTEAARRFVEREYLPRIGTDGPSRNAQAVCSLLRPARVDLKLDGKHRDLARCIAEIHSDHFTPSERTFYQHHLVDGGDGDKTRGLQRQLAELLVGLRTNGAEFSATDLRAVIKMASHAGLKELSVRLEAIRAIESLLVPASAVFAFAQSCHHRSLLDVGKQISQVWGRGLEHIDLDGVRARRSDILKATDERSTTRWLQIAESLVSGDYRQTLDLILSHNAEIMRSRNGAAPWLRVDAGHLVVRYNEGATQFLPAKADLAHEWRNTYFLNSLKAVAGTLSRN
jgi:hypothetical protein